LAKSPGSQFKPWTSSDVEELRAFAEEEMTVEEVARELGRPWTPPVSRPARKGFGCRSIPQTMKPTNSFHKRSVVL
jgi:hypothetical protein